MIRWGILGAASIARRRVIPAIQASRNSRVTAIASRDPERAQVIATEHAIPVVHADYAHLLADPDIDAIYLPLVNSEHHAWVIAAARAGKHILCEKPLALDATEATEMVDAAAQAQVLLAEGFMYRFHPRIERLLDIVRSGQIGATHIFHSTMTFPKPAAGNYRLEPGLGGGALMDVGCYAVNLARLLAGEEPAFTTGQARYGSDTGVDESFAGILRFPSGMLGVFNVSLASQFGVHFEVIGATGKVVVPQGFRPETDRPTELYLERGMDREVITVEPADQYRLMVEDFADAITNRRPPRYGPADAVANMRTLDALRAAAAPSA